jgi:integral membrane sensor domain MASE1
MVPACFCTASDAFLPYLGGKFIELNMHFHWCFLKHLDVVLPFLCAGIINGLAMSSHPTSRRFFYSVAFHFVHIFVSSMAAMLYLMSFGFYEWWERMGFVFIFLIFAVLIPCTMSDIVIPMLFARIRTKKKVVNVNETH